VQWMGRQAAVTLPEHIDVSNAGSIGEELLSVINRGATVLIADMAATVSCDDAGVDAVVRAYQRAVAKGTQLRLVVTAQTVRGVLSLSGLSRLVSIYPSRETAIAAGAPAADAATAAEQSHLAQELLDRIVRNLFKAGLGLQAALDLPRDVGRQRITEALQHLDDTIQEIRGYVFPTQGQGAGLYPAPPNGQLCPGHAPPVRGRARRRVGQDQ
jgi:anti-anti-sigma factor